MIQITKDWGVVYDNNVIQTIKTPENNVYVGKGRDFAEFDSEAELNLFIEDNELRETKHDSSTNDVITE